MTNDIAIKVENLSKYYRLGVINNGTLFRDIQSWWARKRGKDDPHAKIGSKYDPTAEGFWALKDLNFEIKKGDRVGIIGHNGAGKSTLLKLLSQITSPTEGSIKINGKIASLLEVGTGFHPEMTGRENIYMNGAILGMKHDEIDKKVNDIIEFSEIGEHIDTPVKRYSSGMYVRLAFAVAAHLDSDILIADEVLAVGDAAFQKKALGKMNELSSGEGRTVLFVSHNMAQVKNLCNKGIVLEKGRIVREDDEIDKSIDWYLSGGDFEEKEKTMSWTNEDHLGDQYFKPNVLQVFSEDSQITASSDIFLDLDFTVEKRSGYMSFEFYIYTADTNQLVCSISPFYSIENYSCLEGNHHIRCTLPKNFFNDRKYRVELQAGLFCQKWILQPGVNSPSVFFVVASKKSYNPFVRVSSECCAPFVEWEIK